MHVLLCISIQACFLCNSYTYVPFIQRMFHVFVYVKDQLITCTVLMPSDGFEPGATVLQSVTNSLKAVLDTF